MSAIIYQGTTSYQQMGQMDLLTAMGLTCGQCIKVHGLAVYSYNLPCVECTDYKYNWLEYTAVTYGPLQSQLHQDL